MVQPCRCRTNMRSDPSRPIGVDRGKCLQVPKALPRCRMCNPRSRVAPASFAFQKVTGDAGNPPVCEDVGVVERFRNPPVSQEGVISAVPFQKSTIHSPIVQIHHYQCNRHLARAPEFLSFNGYASTNKHTGKDYLSQQGCASIRPPSCG